MYFYIQIGKVCHIIGHVLGFFHEQSRPDREDYVNIIYDNIQPYKILEFQYYPTSVINTYGLPYDYSSIMHFGQSVKFNFLIWLNSKFYHYSIFKKEYSRDPFMRLVTINTSNPDYQKTIGQRVGLSYMDIKTINVIYCKSK